PVLRQLAVLAHVPALRGPGTEIVPGRHLVPAPRREPVRERQVDQAPGLGGPDHFLDQPARIPDVLEHVRRNADVGAAVTHRQPEPVREYRTWRGVAAAGHLALVYLEQVAVGPTRAEFPGDVARSTADVEHRAVGNGAVFG